MRSITSDPIRNFKFQVIIPKFAQTGGVVGRLGFQMIAGLALQTEPITYREGGDNTTSRKMPGQTDFPPLVCTRGLMPTNNHGWNWMREIFYVLDGQGRGGPGNEFRTDMLIMVNDHPVNTAAVRESTVKVAFKVFSAWPSSMAFSDLDAQGNGIIVEQMTLMHEGFAMHFAGGQVGGGQYLNWAGNF